MENRLKLGPWESFYIFLSMEKILSMMLLIQLELSYTLHTMR
jgi:hypothetical protein